MSFPFLRSEIYTVSLPVYEGPLDLLLDLIERAELDITSVALAQVTDQYLVYVRSMQGGISPEEISSFLVIAAKLIQIKSEALLPRPPAREAGEEDPGESLARQLRLYKRFKEIAAWLEEREAQRQHTYLRVAPPPKVEGRLDLSDITLDDLLAAAEAIFALQQDKQALGTVIRAPRVTIREKIQHIRQILSQSERATFRQMIGIAKSRLEVVVTFLALLELVKRYRVTAIQESLFGEIQVEPLGDLMEDEDFELEFE